MINKTTPEKTPDDYVPIENEVWKDIEGYEGYYQVSNMGRIKNLNWSNMSNYIMPFHTRKFGANSKRHQVALRKGSEKPKFFFVRTLVANAFLDKPEGISTIKSINGDGLDDRAKNLRFVKSERLTTLEKNKRKNKLNLIDLVGEEWRDTVDFPNYQVSNYGRVKRKAYTLKDVKHKGHLVDKHYKEKPIEPYVHIGVDGVARNRVTLMKNGKRCFAYLAPLVASAFIPKEEQVGKVSHINGNLLDDTIGNLAYTTGKIVYDNERASFDDENE